MDKGALMSRGLGNHWLSVALVIVPLMIHAANSFFLRFSASSSMAPWIVRGVSRLGAAKSLSAICSAARHVLMRLFY